MPPSHRRKLLSQRTKTIIFRWRADMRLDDYDPGDDIRDLGRGGGGFGGGGGGGMGGLLVGLLPMLLGRKMGCGTILLLGVLAFVFLGPGANMLSTGGGTRSEEHTSELQSLMRISYAVFCLKKKKTNEHQHLG